MKSGSLRGALLLLSTLALSTGCFTLRSDLPGTLRADLDDGDVEVLGDLDFEVTQPYFAFGLIGTAQPNMFAREIEREARAKGADGVRALRIEATFTVSDLLVGCAGCGGALVATRTYRIRGELVRIKKPPLPGTLSNEHHERMRPTSMRF
jgi:hypothetical protein